MFYHKGVNDLPFEVWHKINVLLRMIRKHAMEEVARNEFLAICGFHVIPVHVIRINYGHIITMSELGI